MTATPHVLESAAPSQVTLPTVIALCRCSSDDQDHSVEDQEREIRAWCGKQSVALEQVFKDDGISGYELDRPGLNQLREFVARSPQKGTVVMWRRDRLCRPEDPLDGLLIEREIRRCGWRIHYLTGPNEVGIPLVDAILGLVEHHTAGEYLRKLAEDSLRGNLARVLERKIPGGKIPYGYAKAVVDPQGKRLRTISRAEKHRKLSDEITRLVPGDPDEIEIVRWVYDEYANGRQGYAPIAGELNSRGVPAPAGGVWVSGSVRELLTNRVYAGDLVWNKETTAKFFKVVGRELARQDGVHTSRLTGKRTGYSANPEHEHVVFNDNHEPLVARATFDRAQQVARGRAERVDAGRGGHWTERRHLLTGLLFCGCGARMNALPATVKGQVYRRYACVGYQRSRTCEPYWVSPALIEQALIGMFAGRVTPDVLLAQTAESIRVRLIAAGERPTRAAVEQATQRALRLLQSPARVLALAAREDARTFFERTLQRVELRFETTAPPEGQKRKRRRFVKGTLTMRHEVPEERSPTAPPVHPEIPKSGQPRSAGICLGMDPCPNPVRAVVQDSGME